MRVPHRSPFVYFTVRYGIWSKNICPSERGGFGLEMNFDVYLQDRNSRVNILVHRKFSVTVLNEITNRGKLCQQRTNFSNALTANVIPDNTDIQLLLIQISLFIPFIFCIF